MVWKETQKLLFGRSVSLWNATGMLRSHTSPSAARHAPVTEGMLCGLRGEQNIYKTAPPRQTWLISSLIQAYACIVCGVMVS